MVVNGPEPTDVVITGAAGFIGRALTARLRAGASVCDSDGRRFRPGRLILCDVAPPDPGSEPQTDPADDAGPAVVWRSGDISDRDFIATLAGPGTACVFHLAGVVSGAAESDFDLGLRVNLDGTRNLLDALKRGAAAASTSTSTSTSTGTGTGNTGLEEEARPVRLVYASSIAVYGAPIPPRIDDGTQPWPTLSYGAHKLACELLISDMSRRRLVDGRSLRLSGVVVRPPQPNGALSAFNSDVIRETLAGRPVVSPVSPAATIWLQSVGRTVENLLHAMTLDACALGSQRAVLLPALACRIDEIVDAVSEVAGAGARRLVSYRPDGRIEPLFGRWPRPFTAGRGKALGFTADPDLLSLIRDCARAGST